MSDPNGQARSILQALQADALHVPEEYRSWWQGYLRDHTDRYLCMLEVIREERLNGKVLDVGCAPGQFAAVMSRLGYEIEGVDLHPERFQEFFEKQELRVARVDIETEALPFEDATFDTVLFAEMIEHLRINPLNALREIHRVLKPGGRLLLSTPNVTPVDRLLFLLGKDYQDDPLEAFLRLEKIGHMGHFRLYTLAELQRFLSYLGFETVRPIYRGPLRGGWKGRVLRLFDPDKGRWRGYLYVLAMRAATSQSQGEDR